jgi:hypothetical protein
MHMPYQKSRLASWTAPAALNRTAKNAKMVRPLRLQNGPLLVHSWRTCASVISPALHHRRIPFSFHISLSLQSFRHGTVLAGRLRSLVVCFRIRGKLALWKPAVCRSGQKTFFCRMNRTHGDSSRLLFVIFSPRLRASVFRTTRRILERQTLPQLSQCILSE